MGGLCSSCCGNSAEETNLMPSPVATKRRIKLMSILKILFYYSCLQETRRRQQLEAAEKRRQENEARGIKDPEKVRRQQQRSEELQRREEEAARMGAAGQPTLKVSVSNSVKF